MVGVKISSELLPGDPWEARAVDLWAVAVYAAVACVFGYPVFHGAFLLSGHSDQYLGGYAVREFGTAVMRTGHLPTWNPYLFGGMPFVGAFDGDIFYPPTVLMRLVMRSDLAVSWAFVLHLIVAGWCTYKWLRASGVSIAAAGIGGLAYEMGGPFASLVSPGHDGKMYVSALLPLVLFLLVRGMRDGRRWSWPALALAVGFAALAPHPQIFEYLLLTAGAYALFLAANAAWSRTAVHRLGAAFGAVALGLLISAVQFLPVAEFVAWSPRGSRATGAGTYSYATQFSMPFEDLPNVYLPQFSGMLEHYWGGLGTHWFSEYLGASVLMLAGAAFVAGAARRRIVLFWASVAVIAIVWSLGRNTPFYHLVAALVPGTAYFRVPAAAFIIVGLAVAALAAEGVDTVMRRDVRVRYVLVWVAAAVVMAIPFVIHAVARGAAQQFGPSWSPGGADANAGPIEWGALRSLLVVAVTGVVLAIRRDDKMSVRVASLALACIVALDLWSIERSYWLWMPPAAETFARDAAIDTLRAQTVPARVLAWPIGHRSKRADPEIAGDALMIHRIRQVLGYHGNGIRRYDNLSWTANGSKPLFTPHFWRLLNIGFVLTDTAQLPFTGGTRIVGPVADAAGDSLYLYRLAGAHPAAWLAASAASLIDSLALSSVIDSQFDLERLALLEPAAHAVAHVAARGEIGGSPSARVVADRYEPGDLRFRIPEASPAGSTLIVSENFYPGWRAKADGVSVPVWRADYSLIGVPLPAGTKTVELTFVSAAVTVGLVVSVAATVAALGWLVWSWSRGLRPGVEPAGAPA